MQLELQTVTFALIKVDKKDTIRVNMLVEKNILVEDDEGSIDTTPSTIEKLKLEKDDFSKQLLEKLEYCKSSNHSIYGQVGIQIG